MILPPTAPIYPYTESLEFGTRILSGVSGMVQAISHGKVPIQTITYSYPLAGDGIVAQWDNLLQYQAKDVWPIPMWGDAVPYVGTIGLGATTISIDTTTAPWIATNEDITGRAVIWLSGASNEIVTISTVAAASLTVSATTAARTGTLWIMPCRTGYLVNAKRTRYPGGAAMQEITYASIDNWLLSDYSAVMEYDSLEVLTTPGRLYSDSETYELDPDVIVIQAATGRRTIASVSTYPTATQTHRFIANTPADCYTHREWAHSIGGKWKAFLVPTFKEDMILSRNVGAHDTDIYVRHANLVDYLGGGHDDGQHWRQYVAFRPAGADIIVRRLDTITAVSATEEKLTIDDETGTAIAAGNALCWADRYRLASDTISLQWQKRGMFIHDALFQRTWEPPSSSPSSSPSASISSSISASASSSPSVSVSSSPSSSASAT